MKQSICRMVVFRQAENEMPVNGTREHPAVITRVHADGCVNLTVFFDAQAPEPRTSVLHTDIAATGAMCWYWPVRG